MALLKLALEIYNGDLKGYAKVPEEKEIREAQMQSYMKDLLRTNIEKQLLGRKLRSRDNNEEQSKGPGSEETAIKVAIEYCLNIGAVDFMFTEILQLFELNNLRVRFIANLEPFLISGQFKKALVPEKIFREFQQFYRSQKATNMS